MELLMEHGYMERENTLKETYMKHLNPDILDYETEEMWKLVGENKIISLFQFDTPVGLQCAKQIQPTSLLELAQANSLMRLMPEEGKLTPVEEFVRYKQEPEKLKEDIYRLRATDKEKEILYNFMKIYGGVLDSQESLMLAVMLPFTNYSVDEANKVRKVVAKKKMAEIEQTRTDYFKKGQDLGTSYDILHYIWDVQAAKQMGYSFSIVHTIAYSTVAIQELNLAYKYPSIFWNTACLIVDSAGIQDEEEEEVPTIIEETTEEETDEEDDEEEVIVKKKEKKKVKTIDYGAVSTSIGKMKNMGINVSAPDINKSKFTFIPDLENNKIIYGIKGISKVNNDYANEIIQNRPYTSLNDFRNKVKSTKLQTINLIKSGAFDELEKCSREELLMEYFREIAGFKNKITMQNLPSLISKKLIPEEFQFVEKVFNFNKFLKKNKSGIYYELDDYSLNFYSDHWDVDLVVFESGKTFIPQTKWDKIYKAEVEVLRPWLKEPTTLDSLNETLMLEVIEKYGMGNRATWEMDSIGFYSDKHELDNIYLDEYEVSDFFSMSETPVVRQVINMNGKDIPLFYLDRIIGTVIDKDKLKNMVTLLTPTGVVKVKIYKPQFIKYDKQLYVKDPITGKKKITEKSWFTRGNKLLITGIRRDDTFVPKVYKKSKFSHPIELVEEINYKKGTIKTKQGRSEE